MKILQHDFTQTIINILNKYFPGYGDIILRSSQLLQYINIKTKAANRGSKSRSSFANHYAIYVLIEDYLQKEFHLKNGYEDYEGAQYINLLMRQRKKYMECIEEVINIPELILRFNKVLEFKRGIQVIEEIVLQSRVEFNMEEEAAGDEV